VPPWTGQQATAGVCCVFCVELVQFLYCSLRVLGGFGQQGGGCAKGRVLALGHIGQGAAGLL
jgi:hypothetical protein